MPQYHKGILCITVDEWLASGLTYESIKAIGSVATAHAKPCRLWP
jgi:hypothetical protein